MIGDCCKAALPGHESGRARGNEMVFYGDAFFGGGNEWLYVRNVGCLNLYNDENGVEMIAIRYHHLVCDGYSGWNLHSHRLDGDEMIYLCGVYPYLLRFGPPASAKCSMAEVATPAASLRVQLPLLSPLPPPRDLDLTLSPIPGLEWRAERWLRREERESSEEYPLPYLRRSWSSKAFLIALAAIPTATPLAIFAVVDSCLLRLLRGRLRREESEA